MRLKKGVGGASKGVGGLGQLFDRAPMAERFGMNITVDITV